MSDLTDAVIFTFILLHFFSLASILFFSLGQLSLVWHYTRNPKPDAAVQAALPPERLQASPGETGAPFVTVQLPVYNEIYVVRRLIEAVSRFDYPRDRFEIQVLDDSTDETTDLVAEQAEALRAEGVQVTHLHRTVRTGYKAGALQAGLAVAQGQFIAIFDADFVPPPSFLAETLPHFSDGRTGMVQTRWTHLNFSYSLLTRLQAFGLNAHFSVEQEGRSAAGFYINFNGTAGVWRKACIEDAGGWQSDTLTEDLDLSYRAQIAGWRFIYLPDSASPAELPAEMHSFKSQQFRWTKGAVETAKKILPQVWAQPISLSKKLHATLHLCANVVFVFVLMSSLLSVPLLFVKNFDDGYKTYFQFASVFMVSFLCSTAFYLAALRRRSRLWLPALKELAITLPLFMALSMGMSLHNTLAVLQGLAGWKSAFIRTPKFSLVSTLGSWELKRYSSQRLSMMTLATMIGEAALALYFLAGVLVSLYLVELSLLPFELLLFFGFAMVAYYSFKHALGRA